MTKKYKIIGNDPYHYFPKDTVVTETEKRIAWGDGCVIGTFTDGHGVVQLVDVSDVIEIIEEGVAQ